MSKVERARKVSTVAPPRAKPGYDAYDLDMVGNAVSGCYCTIHMGTGSVNNSGNCGNGDGDSKNAGQTCPNSVSDGVMAFPPILTSNPGMASSYANVTGKKKRVKSIALKAKKESSDDETSTSGSDDEEYAMAVRNFKRFFRRKGKFVRQPREENKSFRQRDEKKGKSDQKCFRCGNLNHLIGDCPKPSRNKYQKAFIGGSWSDSENDDEDKTNDKTCLMAQSSNEVCLKHAWNRMNGSKIVVAPNI
nr:zf-CCHC domain-containing protein [Tanacetum cinerariifolium]